MRTARVLAALGLLAGVAAAPRPLPAGPAWTHRQILTLSERLNDALASRALRGAQIGLLVVQTHSGRVLYARNAGQEFEPASNFKLLVGSTALHVLGPNFFYVTTLLASGAEQGGTLDGDLYLRGGGDALLSDGDLDAAARAVAAAGITRVTGSVVTDAFHDDDQRLGYGWSWDDLSYYYAPVVSALELNDGVVHVRMIPGDALGAPVSLSVTPHSGALTIENNLQTGPRGSRDTSAIVRPWDAPRTIELVGSYPQGAPESGDIAPSVPDPPSYAGDVFARALQARGIAVEGGVRAGRAPQRAVTLWSHDSLLMPALLARFWYPSDNLMGELLLKELGAAVYGEPGSDGHGAAVERRYLRGIGVDPHSVTIADGSGLSSYDRITPRALVAILQADWFGPYRRIVLNALPLAGERGTLAHSYRNTPAQGRVFAKTGSINHVRTISGYVFTKTHGTLTFSFLVNQWMGESATGGVAALARVRAAVLSLLADQ